jgi:hypothetical protein
MYGHFAIHRYGLAKSYNNAVELRAVALPSIEAFPSHHRPLSLACLSYK